MRIIGEQDVYENFRGVAEESNENPVKIAGLQVDIWTRNLPNTKQACW